MLSLHHSLLDSLYIISVNSPFTFLHILPLYTFVYQYFMPMRFLKLTYDLNLKNLPGFNYSSRTLTITQTLFTQSTRHQKFSDSILVPNEVLRPSLTARLSHLV